MEILEQLVDAGLFMTKTDWRKAVNLGAASPEVVSHIQSTGIVTKNRPLYAGRCVDDAIAMNAASGKRRRLCVYDDSLTPETFDAVYQRGVVSARSGTQMDYCGIKQKTRFRNELRARNVIPPSVLYFALGGLDGVEAAYGRNMNWMLLDTSGSMAACLDDDVLCNPAMSPSYVSGLNLSSVADPTDLQVYSDRSEALASLSFEEPLGLITVHEEILGRSVHDCIRRRDQDSLNVSDIGSAFMNNLLVDRGHVLVSMTGIAGDSATAQNWLHLSGEARDRLGAQSRLSASILDSHEVLRSVKQYTITDVPRFMNYACGLDNRTLLPPFLPVCRNMDGVFAMTVRCCYPHNYVGYVPYIVRHDPPARGLALRRWARTTNFRHTIFGFRVFGPARTEHRSDCEPSYAGGTTTEHWDFRRA